MQASSRFPVRLLIGFLLFGSFTLGFGALWGYSALALLKVHTYSLVVFLIPGLLTSLLLFPREDPASRLASSLVLGLVLILADYFLHVRLLETSAWGALYVCFYAGFALAMLFRPAARGRVRDGLREIATWLEPVGLPWIATLAFLGLVLFAVFSVPRPEPASFFSGGSTILYPDFLWNMGTTTSLTRSFPALSMNLDAELPVRYHVLVHIVAAHLSKLVGIAPSLAFLNYVHAFVALLFLLGLVAFSLRFGLARPLLVMLLFCLIAHFGYVSESLIISAAPLLSLMVLMGPDFDVASGDLRHAVLRGLALALCVAAKGSAGTIFLSALLLFVAVDVVVRRNGLPTRAVARLAIIGLIWIVTYVVFFYGSIPERAQFGTGAFRHIGISGAGLSYPLVFYYLPRIEEAILAVGGNPLLVAVEYLAVWLAKLVSWGLLVASSFAYFTGPFFLGAAIFALPQGRRRRFTFLLAFALIAFLLQGLVKFPGGGRYFGVYAGIGMAMLCVCLFGLLAELQPTRRVAPVALLVGFLMLAVEFSWNSWLHNDFAFSFTDRILHERDRMKRSGGARTELSPQLYEALRYIRDRTDPEVVVIHSRGIQDDMYKSLPSYVVSGFSERRSYLESLGFVLGEKARPTLQNLRNADVERLPRSESDAEPWKFLRIAKRNFDAIEGLFADEPDPAILESLIGGNYLILGRREPIGRLERIAQENARLGFENDEYAVLHLRADRRKKRPSSSEKPRRSRGWPP